LEADGTFEHDDPVLLADRYRYRATFNVQRAIRLPGNGATPVMPWFYNEAPVARWAEQSLAPLEEVDVACGSGSTLEDYEITLPANMTVVSLPQGTAFSSPYLTYEATYRMDGQVLKVRRTLEDRSPPPICSPEVMKAFRAGAEGVLTDLRQQLIYK
jgi:hypothetical protein